jgi:predicted dienelactone hydrolase
MRSCLLSLLVLTLSAAEVAEIDRLYLLDAGRDRNIGIKVYHPLGLDGPLPLVLFSHGLGGSQWGYAYLGRHLAAHGYISVHCTHPGSDWLLWDGKGFGTAMANLRKAQEDPAIWRERPRDLCFILDHLQVLEQQAPALAGRFDLQRIAVAGHSLGAFTALALAGLRPTLPEGQVDLADPRPRAFVAMSPQGSGGFQQAGAWSGISRPVLLMTGTEDEQPMGGSGHGLAWRMEAWQGIPEGLKSLLVIDGATHMAFAGGGMGERPDASKMAAICVAATAFLDARLAGQAFSPPAVAGGRWLPEPSAQGATSSTPHP